jgi:hypothetical protein
LKLRFQLVQGSSGQLPAACQLPDGYSLEIASGRQVCQHCRGQLRRVRTSTHRPVGLMWGRPHARLIHQQCTLCGQADSLEVYYQEVPPRGNYAYDLMVEVGLARFRDHRQDGEIQSDLQTRWGLSLPASSIGLLADSFLDGLAAVHQGGVPALRRQLDQDGGYAMHVDGTCEAETDVLFTALAEPRGWMLEAVRMTSENTVEIAKLMRRCGEQFGNPLAVVRDLSSNIAKAKRGALPEARDLICHYHFLENVGNKLCQQPHAKLTMALRRLKVCPALRSIRMDLVRWSRKAERLSTDQIEHLLSHPDQIVDLDAIALRRFVAYLGLRWLGDYKADLHGEYFPFDLPQLAFYRRGLQLGEMLRELVALPGFPERELSTLKTIAGHLGSLRDDVEVVAAAARLEKAAAMFEELRKVLRLSSRPDQRLLRQRGPSEGPKVVEQMQKRLHDWRDRLHQRHDREPDEQKRADQATVLKYMEKYEQQLVGHVIELEGDRKPLVVQRTNNPAEHRFGSMKQGVRRKVGVKKLTRQIQAMRPEAFLVWNLSNREYVNLVLDGSLANLPSSIAKHWDLAQAIRKERLQSTTDHPMPTTKQQLRHPQLLENVKQAIAKIVETTAKETRAA